MNASEINMEFQVYHYISPGNLTILQRCIFRQWLHSSPASPASPSPTLGRKSVRESFSNSLGEETALDLGRMCLGQTMECGISKKSIKTIKCTFSTNLDVFVCWLVDYKLFVFLAYTLKVYIDIPFFFFFILKPKFCYGPKWPALPCACHSLSKIQYFNATAALLPISDNE